MRARRLFAALFAGLTLVGSGFAEEESAAPAPAPLAERLAAPRVTLYATLAERGFLPRAELATLRKIDSRLQGHRQARHCCLLLPLLRLPLSCRWPWLQKEC